jgi:glucose-1-phosphate cytidylyltransferase
MKAVILAGGLGTRLAEETGLIPKPLVEVGGRPILWHIMKIFSTHGVTDFVICLGYKGHKIKEYFANYFLHTADVTFSLSDNGLKVHQSSGEPWNVTLVDTGELTATGGRLKRAQKYLEGESDFYLTYGDGVGDVDVTALVAYHQGHGRLATVTAASPVGRFGLLSLAEDGTVERFEEKPEVSRSWVNAGFFVLKHEVLDLIKSDSTSWELDSLVQLTQNEQLLAFRHSGFWQPMDTLSEKNFLNELWASGDAPWKVWE